MCGIVGIRRFDGADVDEGLLRRMTARLVHRGPDDEGFWRRSDVGLGHRRLSIIDPVGSPQPMSRGTAHVSFNGEIFNYAELRKELMALGHAFRTQGDTEVLLAQFLERGASGVESLNGQFAYAIYDEGEDELWLFRDRLGVLPLYYYWDGRLFLFGSEIKALLAALPDPTVDRASLKEYLAYRSVPAPHTLFEGIRKLPPGHRLRLGRRGELQIEPYWKLPTEPSDDSIEPERAVESLESALSEAVSSRMVADVPVGAYLSGGVDSSLVVALMSRLCAGGGVETYAAGFDDPRFDELPYAAAVSRRLGTRHHEVSVRAADFEELWPRLTWHRDAPISEPADVAVFRLASLARENVKVLLSGEGSDELFAGYPKYRFAQWSRLAEALPPSARGWLLGGVERSLPERLGRVRILLRAMSAPSEADRLQTWFAPFTRSERDRLLEGEERAGHREIWSRTRGDRIQRMLYVDCHTWLVDNLLERGDRMAMAASVESRPPFLDHRLVELAFRLPSNVKLRGATTKWVVKEVARRLLPTEIVDRRKVGFRVPLDAWFRQGLREMAHDLLLGRDSFVADVLARDRVEALLASHARRRRNEESRIWTLLGLEVWHRVFFRGGDPAFGAARTGH